MSNTYTTAHALHRALDRLLVANVAARDAILATVNGEALVREGLQAMVAYERLRDHVRLAGPTEALASALYAANWTHDAPQEPWDSVTSHTREHWRGLAQAVIFSGLVTL